MKYFTIYASRNDTQGIEEYIADIFDNGFKIERNDNEYSIRSKKLFNKNHIFIKIASEESEPDYFSRNIPGMMGFYESKQMQDERTKTLVFTQISVINTMIAIQTDKEYDDGYFQRFLTLTNRVSGIGFLPDGTLLGQDGLVIVHPDGTTGPSKFTPHACTNKIRNTESKTTEGEARKQKSIAYLTENHIPFIEHLPELPPLANSSFRSQEEIARRAIALLLVIQFACDVANGAELDQSREVILNLLKQYEVEDDMTENERHLLFGSQPSKEEAIPISWQYEAFWTLIWALGLVEALQLPNQLCDCDYAIQTVSSCNTFEEFVSRIQMRSGQEILDEADKIYRLHWACVNARVREEAIANDLNESIVMERRRALFWLIQADQEPWDQISMDT